MCGLVYPVHKVGVVMWRRHAFANKLTQTDIRPQDTCKQPSWRQIRTPRKETRCAEAIIRRKRRRAKDHMQLRARWRQHKLASHGQRSARNARRRLCERQLSHTSPPQVPPRHPRAAARPCGGTTAKAPSRICGITPSTSTQRPRGCLRPCRHDPRAPPDRTPASLPWATSQEHASPAGCSRSQDRQKGAVVRIMLAAWLD